MPKGYDDVRTGKEVKTRKKQLEQSHDTGTNPVVPAASSPLHSTPSRQRTKRASSITSISTRTCLHTSAINGMSKANPSSSRKFSSTAIALITKQESAELRTDPDAWRAYLDKRIAYSKQRRNEDAEWREHGRSKCRQNHKSRLNDPAYKLRNFLRDLVMQYPWPRTGLSWKLYRPIITLEPV